MLISSRFSVFAGFGLPCDFRETITIPATANDVRRFYSAGLALAGRHTPLSGFPVRRGFAALSQVPGSAAGALSSGSPKARPGGGDDGWVCWQSLPVSCNDAPARLAPRGSSVQKLEWGKSKAPGIKCTGSGNEGVGEHVRTRFHLGPGGPVKLRSSRDPHRTKKTSFFCRTGFRWSA